MKSVNGEFVGLNKDLINAVDGKIIYIGGHTDADFRMARVNGDMIEISDIDRKEFYRLVNYFREQDRTDVDKFFEALAIKVSHGSILSRIKKSISIKDFERMCMKYYINRLEEEDTAVDEVYSRITRPEADL